MAYTRNFLIDELDNGDIAIICDNELKIYEIKENKLQYKNTIKFFLQKSCMVLIKYYIYLQTNF